MGDQLTKHLFFEKKGSSVPSSDEKEKSQGKRKIFTWGPNNDYPQWLNGLFKNNAIHSGIIRSKVHYTVSGGLTYSGDENDQEDLIKWERMFNNGLSEFNLDEVSEHMSLDYEISNVFYVRGRWNLDFTAVEKIELLDFEKCRKVVGSTDILWSPDWTDKKRKVKTYKLLNLKLKGTTPEQGVKRPREFYIEFQERSKQAINKDTKKANKGIYPDPPYSGGIKSICTGIEIDEYQNAEIINGFSLGTIINLNNGEPRNEDDKKALKKGLQGAATGSSQAGGTWVLFNNGKDREATVQHLQGSGLNKRYIEVNKDTQKNILRAHSVTAPILFGFKEEGSLGNATELEVGYAIMQANYFKSRQDSILSVLNFVGQKCNGLKGEISFNPVVLDLPKEGAPEEIEETVIEATKFQADKAAEENILKALQLAGEVRADQTILFKNQVTDSENVSEEDCLEKFRKECFVDLPENTQQVLNQINDGNGFQSIKVALELSSRELALIYQDLIRRDFISPDGVLSETGLNQVAESQAQNLEILYSYELREDIPGPAILPDDRTRPFCEALITLDRLYTREEIDFISAQEGRDVFSFKGGWYHNPDTDQTTPFCRHTWVQNVVFNN